jgi:hypothetical protein
VVDGVDVTVVVCVLVEVDVCVDVWVDVSVDVPVDVCVFVDVSVVLDVVWLDDVRVGSVRVALGVGPNDGGDVGASEGPVVCDPAPSVRDGLGRLLPPAHAARTTARIAPPTINVAVRRRVTFDPPSFVRPVPRRNGTAAVDPSRVIAGPRKSRTRRVVRPHAPRHAPTTLDGEGVRLHGR